MSVSLSPSLFRPPSDAFRLKKKPTHFLKLNFFSTVKYRGNLLRLYRLVVNICGGWLSSLKQNPHFINSLTRLKLLKIAPPYIAAPTSLLI